MLLKLLKSSFTNQKKSTALMIVSVAVGTALAASLITLSYEINRKVSNELRAFGANIVIEPRREGLADLTGQTRYLRQEDIVKAKTIFWRHNILGVTPVLEAGSFILLSGKRRDVKVIGTWFEQELPLPGDIKSFTAGARTTSPWWHVEGKWPGRKDGILLGSSLAKKLGIEAGGRLPVEGREFRVTGILETGGVEDESIVMDLERLQALKGLTGKISKIFVSALTTPMDDFAYRDPKTMSRPEYEKWYCTGYVTSIAKQLEEVFPGSRAKPVWQVAETEGRILSRLTWLIYFLCFVVLVASALGVSATMVMSTLRRTGEIGLMKALGADRLTVAAIFISEALVIGVLGGVAGYGLSTGASRFIGLNVFNTTLEQKIMVLPLSIAGALVISVAGTILPIRRALRIKPAVVLKES